MIQEGVVPPFCNLLSCQDTQVIQVTLDGISNMLKMAGEEVETLTNMIEECGGQLFTFSQKMNYNIHTYFLILLLLLLSFCT